MFIPVKHAPAHGSCKERQAFMAQLNRTTTCHIEALTNNANAYAFTINTVAYAAIPS